jgi:hypothetical protein
VQNRHKLWLLELYCNAGKEGWISVVTYTRSGTDSRALALKMDTHARKFSE